MVIGDRRRRSGGHWGGLARGLLSAEAINREKEEEEGEWNDGQISLGFTIKTGNVTIGFPEGKRDGSAILFGQLFREFGSRVMRFLTLQCLRGNIEHFRSTDMIWSFFTGPIDGLM